MEQGRGPRHPPVMGSGGGSEDPVVMLSPSGVLCPPPVLLLAVMGRLVWFTAVIRKKLGKAYSLRSRLLA